MLKIEYRSRFKKEYKAMLKRGVKASDFEFVVSELAKENTLEAKYFDHALEGKFGGFRECHINPDWLLVYCIQKDRLVLTLARTGTHSDLF